MISDEELKKIILESLNEAEAELSDNGKTLNIHCDFTNGNSQECEEYSKQILQNDFTADDMSRFKRLTTLCGIKNG